MLRTNYGCWGGAVRMRLHGERRSLALTPAYSGTRSPSPSRSARPPERPAPACGAGTPHTASPARGSPRRSPPTSSNSRSRLNTWLGCLTNAASSLNRGARGCAPSRRAAPPRPPRRGPCAGWSPAPAGARSAQQLLHIRHDRVHVHHFRLYHVTARKRQQLAGQVGRALGRAPDLLHVLRRRLPTYSPRVAPSPPPDRFATKAA